MNVDKEEERDFGAFKPRTPFKLDEKTKAQLPLWRPYVCGSCGSDNLQVEISSDKDAVRFTCWDCDARTQLALQLSPGRAPKAGYGSCGPCKVHFDTKAEADEHFRMKHGKREVLGSW